MALVELLLFPPYKSLSADKLLPPSLPPAARLLLSFYSWKKLFNRLFLVCNVTQV